jgi:hypothetical protein
MTISGTRYAGNENLQMRQRDQTSPVHDSAREAVSLVEALLEFWSVAGRPTENGLTHENRSTLLRIEPYFNLVADVQLLGSLEIPGRRDLIYREPVFACAVVRGRWRHIGSVAL